MFIHWEQLQCKYLLCFNVAVVHGSPSQGLLVQTEIRVCSKANDAYVLMVECSARVVQGIQWCLCKNYRSDLFYITDVDLTAQARFSGMRRNLAIPRVSHIYRVSLSSELIGNESGGGEEPLVTEIIVKTTYCRYAGQIVWCRGWRANVTVCWCESLLSGHCSVVTTTCLWRL